MACSCSSTSFTSFTGASVSSRGSSSCSSSSSTSAPASVSFHHLQHQLTSLSSTHKHSLLRFDCENSSKKTSYVAVIARQGQYDNSKKNTSQKGTGGGRSASVAVKEDKAGRKGANSDGRNPKPYNNNKNNNNNSNTRSYNSSSNPRQQNNSSNNKRGNRLAVVDEEEDDEEDSEEEGSSRNVRSTFKPDNSSRNSTSFSARRGESRLSVVKDKEEEEEEEDDDEDEEEFEFDEEDGDVGSTELLAMPIPPAGFVLDEDGSVSLMAPPHNRITTMVDVETKRPLDCLIRRVFSSSDGRQCFLLCPLDTPLQILKIEDGEVLKEVSEEELEDILPTAAYELAKRRLHLVQSGFCLTLRGGFCFSEEDVMDLNTVYGESGSTSLNEGVEIASFVVNESEYLMFTPLDPLMFVAYKHEKTGELLIAEDDLLEDDAVLDAIDEEKEFQAYMEEEEIMDESSDEEEE